ncbi:MAG: hypothetical protein V1773_19790 [bacterium]
MNPKIDKDYNSSEFINKVIFYILILLVLFIFLGDMYIMNNGAGNEIKYEELQIGMITYPWLTAGSVMIYDIHLGDNNPITLTKYLPASISILFSSIVFFVLIPFTLIFSVSSAFKLFKKEKSIFKLFIKYPVINLIISGVVILIFTVSLIVQSFAISNNKQKLDDIFFNQNIKDGGIQELSTLSYLIREKWSISQKNNGWFGLSSAKPDVFKQKVVNILNIQKFNYLENFELKEISQSAITLTAFSKQLKDNEGKLSKKPILFTLLVQQQRHKITLN